MNIEFSHFFIWFYYITVPEVAVLYIYFFKWLVFISLYFISILEILNKLWKVKCVD